MTGTLYVIATPIGNLEDITLRAQRLLRDVDVLAAEDTRLARRLLLPDPGGPQGARGRPRLISYNEHNRARRIPELLAALAQGDVALVSDAGTPAISDPGAELVAAARAAGHAVAAVPGPSAVIAALSVAGLRARTWRFAGFLPRAPGTLRRLLAAMQQWDDALVAFEAPSRLRVTLQTIAEALPERRVAVCRELTKVHEEVFVGTAADAAAHFQGPRGEFVLIIEGNHSRHAAEAGHAQARGLEADAAALAETRLMRSLGLKRPQAAALLQARYGLSRRRAYQLWLEGEATQAAPGKGQERARGQARRRTTV